MAWQKAANRLQNDRKHPIAQTLKKAINKTKKSSYGKDHR